VLKYQHLGFWLVGETFYLFQKDASRSSIGTLFGLHVVTGISVRILISRFLLEIVIEAKRGGGGHTSPQKVFPIVRNIGSTSLLVLRLALIRVSYGSKAFQLASISVDLPAHDRWGSIRMTATTKHTTCELPVPTSLT